MGAAAVHWVYDIEHKINRDHSVHIGRGQINYLHDFTIGLIYSILLVLICLSLKHSSFWPSADVEPIKNHPVHAMPWQCMLDLPMFIL